jgi:Sulfotransferase family
VQEGRFGLPIPNVVKWIIPVHLRRRIGETYADHIEPVVGRMRLFPYDIRQTIVITGSPRSGTTWLAELLGTIPRSAMLWEPLFLDADPELRRIGFGDRTYIPPDGERPDMEAYLRRVLTGRTLNRWTLQHTNVFDVCRVRQWIVKFVRANMLLPWLVRRFPVRRPLVLIRHPCAVVASQSRIGAWKHPVIPDCPEFFDAYPHLRSICSRLKTQEEILAARWCMDNFVPLSTPPPHAWRVVPYERLVRDGPRELQRIFSELNVAMPREATTRLRTPSASATPRSRIRHGLDPLDGWRSILSPVQCQRVLDVTAAFGLDVYGHDLEPDYGRLAD